MRYLSIFLLSLLTAMMLHPAAARADIMISPIYVIFDGRTRSADVTVLNTTDTTNVYRLEWSLTSQKQDGSYEKIETPPPGMIDPRNFVRFSPRQFTLLPQARQLVRIQLQKPADLPDGEYRLHLNFKRLPNDAGLPKNNANEPGIRMELRVTLGISMPVVIRQGEYKTHAEIADARFVERPKSATSKQTEPQLMVKVTRTGTHGTYGRLRVFWENKGEETLIGTLNNFSVYADNPDRIGYVGLTQAGITSGQLRVVYEGDGPQRGAVLAERILRIAP